jgi:cytochrome c biogenesis factor
VVLVESVRERPTRRDALLSFILLFIAGLMCSLLSFPTANFLANLGLPFVLVLLGATTFRLMKGIVKRSSSLSRYSNLRHLALFGVGLLLLGVFVSSSMQGAATQTVSAGGDFRGLGLTLSIRQITIFPSGRQVYLAPYGMVPESIDTRVVYDSSDQLSGSGTLLLRYYPAYDRFVSLPSIHRSLTEDIYIVASATPGVREAAGLVFRNNTSAVSPDIVITVKTIPAVSFVWIGAAVMVAGNIPFMFLSQPLQGTGMSSQRLVSKTRVA